MIYGFTWSGLDATVTRLALQEAMRFGNTLKHTIKCVLETDPALVPVYLSKLDFTDVYMCLWVRMEDTPFLASLIPKKHSDNPQLIGFHLYLPMGYIDRAALFCVTSETSTDIANTVIARQHVAPPHPLDKADATGAEDDTGAPTPSDDATWNTLTPYQKSNALTCVDVYLDEFILVLQGGQTECQQMTHHLFATINNIFRPNMPPDTHHKEPISVKKPR